MSTLITAHGLARDIDEFLRFKRAMGMPYLRGEFDLNSLRRFIVMHWGERTPVALDDAVRQWTSRIDGRKAVTVGNEFGVVRQLCLFRRRRDPSSYVPEHTQAPVKQSTFVPYIFNHDEVRRLIEAASSVQRHGVWGQMLRTLILVLYCTGLRLGEAVRLSTQDVDLRRCTFMIHHSKRRSRIVPFRADLAEELRRYLAARRQLVGEHNDDPAGFFLRLHGEPLTTQAASDAIRQLLRQLGIKPPSGRVGARPYELRHAFAVHRLTAWALAGEDMLARLPWLSAYLGHLNVLGTEVYLKATPQLLELAGQPSLRTASASGASTPMKRSANNTLLALVESFFREYLQRMRGASAHTVRSYRDCLKLLFEYVATQKASCVADLELGDLTAEMVATFLGHLEAKRSNSATTRNCRLAAIKSFFKHLVRNDLAHSQQYARVLAIPSKRARRRPPRYLEADDMRAILAKPDRRTAYGWRDYTLLLFLYNTGARVSEAADVRPADLQLSAPRQVRLRGKGKKERVLPIWRETASALHRLIGIMAIGVGQHVFVNRLGEPLSRDGIAYILQKHVKAAATERPSIARLRITPHVMRHSCAVALLQSGSDPTVIRDYLGHSSVATTNRYITTNLQMKRDALEAFWKHAGLGRARPKTWKPKSDLLAFLTSL